MADAVDDPGHGGSTLGAELLGEFAQCGVGPGGVVRGQHEASRAGHRGPQGAADCGEEVMHGNRRPGAVAQSRSRTATGSWSPAMATSIAALSSRALLPNASSMLATDTPAAAAIERIVVAG